MTTITLDLPADLYERLQAAAAREKKPVDTIVQDWIEERLPPPAVTSEREAAREVLRAAGLLTEPGPAMKARAARSTATLDEVRAALDRARGKPLSEEILDMRGPND